MSELQPASPSAAVESVDADPKISLASPGPAVLRGVARGGALNILSAACNQAVLFIATAAVARYLGKIALGEYALGLAMLSLVGTFALFGFQMTLTRYVAVHLADGDVARLHGTIRFGLSFSFLLSVVLSGCLIASATPLATLFGRPEFAGDLRIVALAIPAGTLRDSCLAAVQGWRTQRAFALVTWVYEPIVRLILTAVAITFGYGLRGSFIALTVGSWSAAAIALRVLRRHTGRALSRRRIVEARTLLRFSVISLGTGLASIGLVWADIILLGILGDTASVGIYNVSTRLINLAVFVMVPVNAAFAPQFAHLLHRKDHSAIGYAYQAATLWILRLSLPAFVILIIFPANLLKVFGHQYVVGAAITIILSVGQIINAGTGPCGTLLNMSGKVGINMANNIMVLIVNIVLNLLFIPRWGMVGAAIAWSASLSLVNIARVIEVRLILRVTPFGRSLLKPVTAAAAAAMASGGVRTVLSSSVQQLVFGITLTIVIYVVVQLLWGVDRSDRELITSLIAHRAGKP